MRLPTETQVREAIGATTFALSECWRCGLTHELKNEIADALRALYWRDAITPQPATLDNDEICAHLSDALKALFDLLMKVQVGASVSLMAPIIEQARLSLRTAQASLAVSRPSARPAPSSLASSTLP